MLKTSGEYQCGLEIWLRFKHGALVRCLVAATGQLTYTMLVAGTFHSERSDWDFPYAIPCITAHSFLALGSVTLYGCPIICPSIQPENRLRIFLNKNITERNDPFFCEPSPGSKPLQNGNCTFSVSFLIHHWLPGYCHWINKRSKDRMRPALYRRAIQRNPALRHHRLPGRTIYF